MRKLITRLAIMWVNRELKDGITGPESLPWVDAGTKKAIVIPPGVVKAPGLLIDCREGGDGDGSLLVSWGTFHDHPDVHYLLTTDGYDN